MGDCESHKSDRRTLVGGSPKSMSAIRSSGPNSLSTDFKLRKAVEFRAAVIGGCLLSVNAGCINAITILETGFAVSHTTGSTTNAAIKLVSYEEFTNIFKYFGLVFFFTFGGTLTGLLGGNYDDFKLGHSYGRIFLSCFALLLAALFFEAAIPNSYTFLFLCAMTCGMQNAMTTKFSGNMIRTTHVSGACTDIGITIGRMLRGRTELSWKLWLLIPMVFSFFSGGLLAAGVHPYLGRKSLLINIFVFGLTGLMYTIYFAHLFKVSYYNTMMGDSEFTVLKEGDETAEKDDAFDFSDVETYRRVPADQLRFRLSSSAAVM